MSKITKNNKLIKTYASALIAGLDSMVSASSSLNHKLSKGELRELFVTNILREFLTKQFDIGSGIIINQKEDQSNQTDIIIYDNTIVPPFIKQQHIGVYPAECVLGTIEVKSNLNKNAIASAETSAKLLYEKIYNPESTVYKELMTDELRPRTAIIGFYGSGAKDLKSQDAGKLWLNDNVKHMQLL